MPGVLYLVSTPIGNLEDITLRALRILREATIIAAEDTRRTRQLLSHFDIHARLVSVREHNERRQADALIKTLLGGATVALVTDAGTPAVSDPGARFVRHALQAGIGVVPIPGPSAILAALAIGGCVTESFQFLGFPPRRGSARREWLDRARMARDAVIFFEAPHRLRHTLLDLDAGDRQLVVCKELTKLHEEQWRGTTADIIGRLTNQVRGEFTVVLAPGTTGERHDYVDGASHSAQDVFTYFSQLTERRLTRAQAVSRTAAWFGLNRREAYALIESQLNLARRSSRGD